MKVMMMAVNVLVEIVDNETQCKVQLRPGVGNGIWIKPEQLDGDGELHIDVDELEEAIGHLDFEG